VITAKSATELFEWILSRLLKKSNLFSFWTSTYSDLKCLLYQNIELRTDDAWFRIM